MKSLFEFVQKNNYLRGLSRKKIVFVTVGVLVLVSISFLLRPEGVLRQKISKELPTASRTTRPDSRESDLPSCGNRKEFFTVSPLKNPDIIGIVPLGFIGSAPEHVYPTDHVYLHIRRDPTGHAYEVPIYAPGDMTITGIKEIKMERPIPNSTDYNLYFKPCEEFELFFNHLSTVSDKIKQEIKPPYIFCDDGEELGRFKITSICEKEMNIEVKAGELLGTVGQLEWQYSVDVGAIDLRIDPLPYANPKLWDKVTKRGVAFKNYIVCPLDYFESGVRVQLEYKLGESTGEKRRTIAPVCGTVAQDVLGTAQGVWDTTSVVKWPQTPELSLIHDFIDPTKGAFAVGRALEKVGIPPEIYFFYPTHSGRVNRDFDEVTADENVYCYDNLFDSWDRKLDMTILIKLTSSSALRIGKLEQKSCGANPWSFGASVEFPR